MKLQWNIILPLLFVFGFLLNTGEASGQNCSQNNVSVQNFLLLDSNGNPFTSGSNYELGEVVNGKLFVTINVSSSGNAYSTKIFFDLIVGGVNTGRKSICISDKTQLPTGVSIYVIDLSWKWGNLVEVKNLYMSWFTSAGKACSELDETSNSQCYTSIPGFTAELPVLPDFSYTASVCNPVVQFKDLTMGGKPPYTYLWDFAGRGTSTLKDPSFTFPGTGTYAVSLTSTDVNGNSNTIIQNVTIPTLTILVDATPSKLNANTGSIKVDISGGNSPYTIDWLSDPEGFSGSANTVDNTYTIYNLGNGTYSITVTDAIGCKETISVFIDWAQILSNPMSDFKVEIDKSKRMSILNWSTESERTACTFIVERAIADVTHFQEIAEIKSTGFSEMRSDYSFTDDHLPSHEVRVYYRIKQVDGNMQASFTHVSSIMVSGLTDKIGWKAFPNPSVHNKLQLAYSGSLEAKDEKILIKIISPQLQKTFETQATGNFIQLDGPIQLFPAGLLLVEIQYGNRVEILKIFKR
ncbi:hypothetical protein P872_10175 [Rhodonellum psychrophilum GCM71 = DSM 17998]|uniref:PKD domain-containing protein n=2 Tax=Rhodonellum TaxID=336827 RepID=U5BZZ7_9BACT|nr:MULTISPECIES: PKD domain-containing protein [Rhodonellum]ERM81477.1 hypothetical protein P872_10175 [Rhodonellum psychrophilum GCM71 = DSM 17998]SDZ29600.1 PKD domain-containing protein [Rhodonellum ikkaensis]